MLRKECSSRVTPLVMISVPDRNLTRAAESADLGGTFDGAGAGDHAGEFASGTVDHIAFKDAADVHLAHHGGRQGGLGPSTGGNEDIAFDTPLAELGEASRSNSTRPAWAVSMESPVITPLRSIEEPTNTVSGTLTRGSVGNGQHSRQGIHVVDGVGAGADSAVLEAIHQAEAGVACDRATIHVNGVDGARSDEVPVTLTVLAMVPLLSMVPLIRLRAQGRRGWHRRQC